MLGRRLTRLRPTGAARRLASDRGATIVFIGILIVPLLAFAALAIDVAQVYATRAELQTAADAAALAAAEALPNNRAVRDVALQYATANNAVQSTILVDSDVGIGFWDAATSTFYPNARPFNGVQVTTRRAQQNGNPVDTFFASVIGIDQVDVAAVAVAARDVVADLVIVQDVTVSFLDELPMARTADKALIDTFAVQYAGGVQIGLVSFARGTTDDAPLTLLSTGQTSLNSAIDGMRECRSAGRRGGPCYGTDLGIGIDRGRAILESQGRNSADIPRVIVLVTDGVPCFLEQRDPVGAGQAAATAAANRAGAAGIDLFSITLHQPSGSSHPCLAADVGFNASLARGIGWGTTTTNPGDLAALLASIVDEMPIRLVR